MQNLDPKDRPKLIGISVALGAVVIIGIVSTINTVNSINPPANASTPTPSPSAPAVSGVTPGTATGPAVAAANTDTAGGSAFALDRFPFAARGGRDPFTPPSDNLLAGAAVRVPGLDPKPVTPETSAPTPGSVSGNRIVRNIGVFPTPNKSLEGFNQERASLGMPIIKPEKPIVRVLPPSPPPYNVVGVVISEPSGRDVAILQRADGTDKKFVVVGDPLDGGYTVTGIESGGVRVKHPGHKPVTSPIPGVAPTQIPGSTEYFLPRQTIVVPPTSMTLPLGEASTPAAPGTPVAQNPAPRAK